MVFRCFLLLLVAALLLAGCRSERVAFRLEPLPAEIVNSTSPRPQRDSLPLAASTPIQNASIAPVAANRPLPRRRTGGRQAPTATSTAVRRVGLKKEVRTAYHKALARPRQTASDDNAVVFAVLFGVVGLALLLSGLITWLGIVLLVLALLLLIGSFFSGKIGG